ncbi:helix-turn-helix domain-containing protein [Curtobacterium sp. MCSS17_015]|uniref:helix-turn-helix domain-containing protein n=1 Tax=Curtobacterium sp. MCSS17_015 TaxID=2175666 RepID=UPI000DA95CC8|nr:helix-turn-helix domain-containing protein [Curtobacterium sp. MCSS17_015]WIB27753.1 helix-turn-helix domain-containing protein [Curtobacterium sp. MCSS17_015]
MTALPDPRTVFETTGTDLDAARAMFEEAYGASGFLPERSERDFGYRFRSVGDATMSFRSTRYDARMVGEVASPDEFVVTWVGEGGGVVDVGRDEVALAPGRPVVFPNERPFRFDLADVRQNLVQIDRVFLERVAAEVHGTEPGTLVLDHAVPPGAEAVRAWNAQVQDAARIVLGSAPVSVLALAETARRTALALLSTFPHHVVARRFPIPTGASGRVRAAVEYMQAVAHTPITTTDVAEHVGLSVRGLQQAFQRQIGVAPNAVLRGIRLDRVRDELRAGSPAETTVASVAVQWGFAHLGRFSAAYARRFGEYPRDTLHS